MITSWINTTNDSTEYTTKILHYNHPAPITNRRVQSPLSVPIVNQQPVQGIPNMRMPSPPQERDNTLQMPRVPTMQGNTKLVQSTAPHIIPPDNNLQPPCIPLLYIPTPRGGDW
eukprot:14840635-Ditylum_brightwellii.AAC.1